MIRWTRAWRAASSAKVISTLWVKPSARPSGLSSRPHSTASTPLTGRTWSHQGYPVSVSELAADRNQYDGQHPSDDFRSSDG